MIPPGIATLIARTRRRWRAGAALRAWSRAAAAASLVVGAALVVHRALGTEGMGAVVLWGSALPAALVAAVWLLAPAWRRPADLRVARLIEERCPELQDVLVTAVGEHAREPDGMSAAVLADAARRVQGIDPDRIVSRKGISRAALHAAAATAVLAVVVSLAAGPARGAAQALAFYVFPERIALEVLTRDVRIHAGEPLRIVARLRGGGTIVPVLRVEEDGVRREARMEPAPDGFALGFERVERDFRYSVGAAGASSPEYSVTVLRPPRVERIDIRYEYPRAFGLEPRREEDGGDIYGPAGTRVHLTVHTDKPVVGGALNISAGEPIPLAVQDATLEGELTIAGDGSYRIALSDADGLDSPGETEYFIRTLEDRPPAVRIVRPATDQRVTSIEEVTIEAHADDDFGVAALDLVYAVRGAAEVVVPFDRSGSEVAVTGQQTLYLEEFDLRPGDFVTYYARTRDVSRGKASTEARSDIFFLEIAPFGEEFVAASSQGFGGGSGDASIDEMALAQKEIITATWSLDRRGREAGRRSDDDIRTVGRAQHDLRERAGARVIEMRRAARMRQRFRPGRPGAAPDPDAMLDALDRAVQAMGTAEEQLAALRTSDALPHEMTALNELLRAQSEVRRREVQRQQQANGRGGAGDNRQQQDLSSIFDRELAQQQQTNYETPGGAEVHEEPADEALEKVRELARRQDELNRMQQETAQDPSMPAEELRRRLERLMREQEELRREADALAQQLGREEGDQQGQEGGSGRGGRGEGQRSGQPDGRALREISESMQGAASALRQSNPEDAAARATRAAQQLRDLEQRLQSGGAGGGGRTAGELQLESQQLADAQRRLASQTAADAGRPDDPAEDARRRAVEQERLADRAERLERAVRELARTAEQRPAERSALDEASDQIDAERLSERMREAARDWQSAAGGRPERGREARRGAQEIAGALEQLSGRLGAAGGQSEASQRLSEALARIREHRQRLAALDRELATLRDQAGSANGEGQGSQPPWDEAKQLLDEVRRENGATTPALADGFNPGRSAPGTEGWKQDFAAWEELKIQAAAALAAAERETASRMRAEQLKDRLHAGADESVPDEYRRLVDRYYRALASGGR